MSLFVESNTKSGFSFPHLPPSNRLSYDTILKPIVSKLNLTLRCFANLRLLNSLGSQYSHNSTLSKILSILHFTHFRSIRLI